MTIPEMTSPDRRSDPLSDTLVDVAVIGGGAAGLSGALMLARSRRSVVVIDSGSPRNAPAEGIHGLLGHEGTPPGEYLARGRAEVRRYGGAIVHGEVVAARPADVDGDTDAGPAGSGGSDDFAAPGASPVGPRFTIELEGGRTLVARRVLVATGIRDELPEVPGLAQHWGRDLVHCPFCHGWEVQDRAIGVIATQPAHAHLALMFQALSEDVEVFAAGVDFDEAARDRFDALGIAVHESPIEEVLDGPGGGIAGVRLAGGEVVARSVLAAGTRMTPRLDGLEGLGLAVEELPGGMGQKVPTGMAGTTEVPGVRVAGNAADPTAQVGASAAAGALAGAHLHGELVMADVDAAVAALAPQG
jgi:thioredoxin reductase